MGACGTASRRCIAAIGWAFLLLAQSAIAQTTMLITDWDGDKVVRFDYPSGEVYDHFVGAGVGPLNESTGLALTPSGDLLVGSYDNRSVQLYDGVTGRFIRTFVESESGGITGIFMMRYGPDGHLYVACHTLRQVFRFDGETGAPLGTVAQGVAAIDIEFGPRGTLFVSDADSDWIAMFTLDGTHRGDVDTSETGLDEPHGMASDAQGNLYVSSTVSDSVIRIAIDTLAASVFVAPGAGGLDKPRGLAFDEEGNLLVCSRDTGAVLKYDADGAFLGEVITPATDGGLRGVWDILLYTPGECRADFNTDGAVDTRDVIEFLQTWAGGCP